MSFEESGKGEIWRQETPTDAEQRSFFRPNDPTQSPSSDSTGTCDRSNTSGSNRSPSDRSSSETSESVNETQKTPEKTPEKSKHRICQTFPKLDKGFSWRKSPPWKRSSLKPQRPPFPTLQAESDVTQRLLSAQVRRIKELKDELCDVQRTLEAVSRENRLLTRLQHRHTRALQKYENPEGGVYHLISRHSNEVRMLRENLRATQQSERGLSLKLKVAESELLKARDSLQRLQRLSEDKHLAEREELNNKLSTLLIKMEIDSSKVKVLEKQLHLTARFYDRQLAIESKKASEACGTARKLQEEILSLQQTVKEKEKELQIKNIYAHRLPRNIWKYGGLYGQGGLMFTKGTQTEREMFIEDQPSAREYKAYSDPQNKNIESENYRKEDYNPQSTSEETPTDEVLQDEENDEFLEVDRKYKEQDQESSTEGPDKLLLEEDSGLEDARHDERNQPDDSCNENKVDSKRTTESRDTRPSLLRLGRRYTFTAATENLHQGLPASGPLPSVSKAHRCKSLPLQHEELSLPKTGNCHEKKEQRPKVSLSDRKKNLMEELFGPGYDVKNYSSSDVLSSDQEFDF